ISKTKNARRPPSLIYLEITGAALLRSLPDSWGSPRRSRGMGLLGDRLQPYHRDLAVGLRQIAAVPRGDSHHLCVGGLSLCAFQHGRADLDLSTPNLEPNPIRVLAKVDEPVRVRR